MRKLIPLSAFLMLATSVVFAQTTPNLTLNVDLSSIKYPVEKLYFSFPNVVTNVRSNDSADIKTNKTVTFTAHIDEPILAVLRVVPDNGGDTSRKARMVQARDIYYVYIEPGKMQLVAHDSISNSTVNGSVAHKDYLKLKDKAKAFEPALRELSKQYADARVKQDKEAMARADKGYDSLSEVMNEKVYGTFLKNEGKKSPIAIYALNQYAGYVINVQKAAPVFDQLSDAVKNLPSGKAFKDKLDVAKKIDIGQYALQFTQKDTSGNDVSLASFKGKYVLMDFWASWCGPCRAENPNVVKAFEKFKDKGFTVLGISLDQPGAKEKWLKAIYDDKLAWTHVSDLKYWNNDVAKLYGVQAIPQNFLIDADGKIVAKNVRGEELQKTLDDIFAAKGTK